MHRRQLKLLAPLLGEQAREAHVLSEARAHLCVHEVRMLCLRPLDFGGILLHDRALFSCI